MRCLIDTNILVSASLFPNSAPARAFFKAVTYPNNGIVCDYSIDELRRVYNKKFPKKISVLESFLSVFLLSVEVVKTPSEEEAYPEEKKVRDKNDRPILRAAIKSKADIILTGDKDFLEAELGNPEVITPAAFIMLS